MPRRNHKRNTRKRGNKRRRGNNRSAFPIPRNTLTIYRGVGRFAPDRLRTKLRYVDTTTSRGTTSNNAMNFYYRSSAYDPDPSLGSGAISGFTELANMYLSYRVLSMTLMLEIMNEEVSGIVVTAWPSNTLQNVNSLSAADVLEYSANVRSKCKLVPNVNGGLTKMSVKATGVNLFGSQFLTDGAYASGTSGNPATPYFINIGCMTALGSNFTSHVCMRNVITMEIEFFEVRQLES